MVGIECQSVAVSATHRRISLTYSYKHTESRTLPVEASALDPILISPRLDITLLEKRINAISQVLCHNRQQLRVCCSICADLTLGILYY